MPNPKYAGFCTVPPLAYSILCTIDAQRIVTPRGRDSSIALLKLLTSRPCSLPAALLR